MFVQCSLLNLSTDLAGLILARRATNLSLETHRGSLWQPMDGGERGPPAMPSARSAPGEGSICPRRNFLPTLTLSDRIYPRVCIGLTGQQWQVSIQQCQLLIPKLSVDTRAKNAAINHFQELSLSSDRNFSEEVGC